MVRRVLAPVVAAGAGCYFGGIMLVFGLVVALSLAGYAILWMYGQEIRAFHYGKIAGKIIHTECTLCGCDIDVPFRVDVTEEYIAFVPDMSDVAAHQWTHEAADNAN